jgi:hypothetical protein
MYGGHQKKSTVKFFSHFVMSFLLGFKGALYVPIFAGWTMTTVFSHE